MSGRVKKRPLNLKVMVSKTEHQMLRALASKDGLSSAGVVRQLIRREHARAYKRGEVESVMLSR